MSFLNINELDFIPVHAATPTQIGGSSLFWRGKRAFDLVASLLLLPIVVIVGLGLLLLNPIWNRGPLFFRQPRMGKGCRAFSTIKFRTMVPAKVQRGANDPIETHRITPLGSFLRKSRLDELPQIINVLRGEMSLIGPRPDYFMHAKRYLRVIPEYRARHVIRPGISGLSQVTLGYAAGIEATRKKAQMDLHYIRHAGLLQEVRIFWATLRAVLCRHGA
jgi:lipopolysaccharide/colanic/teichoic acid biosynthesis glycosyltransferase